MKSISNQMQATEIEMKRYLELKHVKIEKKFSYKSQP